MKKILILTAKAFFEDLDYIYLILQKKYLERYTVETLNTMKDEHVFDYAYIIISQVTPKDEQSSLIRQARLWTQDKTSIIVVLFDTVAHCEEKIKQREKKRLHSSVIKNINFKILKNLN